MGGGHGKLERPGCVFGAYVVMCASCVSTYMRSEWYRDLDVEAHQELSGYALYESLLTYVAHMVLVGDPLQGTCHARASEILITKIRKILCIGYRRIFP